MVFPGRTDRNTIIISFTMVLIPHEEDGMNAIFAEASIPAQHF